MMAFLSINIAKGQFFQHLNFSFKNFSLNTILLQRTLWSSAFKLLSISKNDSFLIGPKYFGVDASLSGSAARAETTSTTQGLNKLQAQELILRLNSEERSLLYSALQEYQSKHIKDEYEVESVPSPTTKNLMDIAVANSIPFIGFGFLDNFFMILFGDYIDMYLGSYLCLTTMAAAALGNTFSDILGIGSAFYVERLANRIGYNPPKLSPIQIEMPVSRRFANIGRVVGVTIGCLLGMMPLLFKKDVPKEEKAEKKVHT